MLPTRRPTADIHTACLDSDVDSVESILSLDRSAANRRNQNGLTPLHVAVVSADPPYLDDILAQLLYAGTDVDTRTLTTGDTAVHQALIYAKLSSAEVSVPLLLKAGASPSIKNKMFRTPFEIAVANDYRDLARLLADIEENPALRRDLDPYNWKGGKFVYNPPPDIGPDNAQKAPPQKTASPVKPAATIVDKTSHVQEGLVQAVVACRAEDVLKQLKAGANVNTASKSGLYPLHYAICKTETDKLGMVNLLLKNGADPTVLTTEKDSSITLAIKKIPHNGEQMLIIKALLNAGCQKTTKDIDGKIAVDWARELRYGDVVHLLETGEIPNTGSPAKAKPSKPKPAAAPAPAPAPAAGPVRQPKKDKPPAAAPAPAPKDPSPPPPTTNNGPDDFDGEYHEIHQIIMSKDLTEAEMILQLGNVLKKGTNVNLQTKDGVEDTPLMIACRRNKHQVVKYLLENNAEVTVRNKNKETPILLSRKVRNQAMENDLVRANRPQVARDRWKRLGIATKTGGGTENDEDDEEHDS